MYARLLFAECHNYQTQQRIEKARVFPRNIYARQRIKVHWAIPARSIVYERCNEVPRAMEERDMV
jgi:hypothetical protein